MIEYVSGAELDSWVPTIVIQGVATTDFSTGYTFQVTVADRGSTTALFTKTTGMTGGTGTVTVAWATSGELNSLTAGRVYDMQLRVRRTSDSRDLVIEDQLRIKPAIA